jgi:hypothetical protein
MLKLREAQNKILLFLFRNLALNRPALSQIMHATFENFQLQSHVVYFCLSIYFVFQNAIPIRSLTQTGEALPATAAHMLCNAHSRHASKF